MGCVEQATVCAKFGLPCIIYMGAKDMERQALNVFRMRLLGAEVRSSHIVLHITLLKLHVNCCLQVPLSAPSGLSHNCRPFRYLSGSSEVVRCRCGRCQRAQRR